MHIAGDAQHDLRRFQVQLLDEACLRLANVEAVVACGLPMNVMEHLVAVSDLNPLPDARPDDPGDGHARTLIDRYRCRGNG